ncbi:hypothetical protein WR25_06716 [Diploscapter pachys]|uniref:Uncharacterized protein n=1 Tax=Diploscapter pachys TaxID=2018661 RepID=A0A2A2M1M4_9BILA|nr:hypothetical protein WR25_06716 [Diploscapter pachys]
MIQKVVILTVQVAAEAVLAVGLIPSPGSSNDESESLPPPPTPRPRQTRLFGNLFGGSEPEQQTQAPPPRQSGTNILQSFFGGFMPTTTTTTETPIRNLFNLFAPQTTTPSPSRLGQINLWRMFGLERTTTTTQAPLEAFLNPRSRGGAAENIDAIMNALVQSRAKPVETQSGPSSFLSSFLGG